MKIKFFSWYGGKIRFVDTLMLLIPMHEIWVEVYGGAGSLTLNHGQSKVEIINDFDEDISNLHKIMADPVKGDDFLEKALSLQHDLDSFNEAKRAWKDGFKGFDEMDRAVSTFRLVSQSFNSTRESYRKNVETWKYQRELLNNLPLVRQRMKGMTVLNVDALELIRKYKDNRDAFLFLDPPYLHELRGKGADKAYKKEMSRRDHIELLKLIRQAKCKILLCCYRGEKDDLYAKHLLGYGWRCYKLADTFKSCQNKEKGARKDRAEEIVWLNYELPEEAKRGMALKEYRSSDFEMSNREENACQTGQ